MAKKTETVSDFLARGGKVTKFPEKLREKSIDVIRKSVAGPAVLMTLDEAQFFFGEKSKNLKTKKVKQSLKIDLNALPPALRAMFVTKLKEESDVEGYEEEIEDLEEDGTEDNGED
jgi:hypothetical protein